jgi:uncharacterized protein (TIGR02118 family)
MVKLIILYKHPIDENTFEEGYNRNLALLEKLPGIVRRQANMVTGGPTGISPYYRILELYFEDFAALDSAMTSPEGVQAGRDLVAYAGKLAELLFVDVFED